MKKLLLTSLLFAGLMGTGSMFAMEGEAPTSAEFETSVEDAKTELDNQEAKQAELESQRDELEQREKDESLTEEERKEAREELEATKKSLADSKVQTDKASRDIETAKSEGNTSEGREALDRANTALKADEALASMESDSGSTDNKLSKAEITIIDDKFKDKGGPLDPNYDGSDSYKDGKFFTMLDKLDTKIKSILKDPTVIATDLKEAFDKFSKDLRRGIDNMKDKGSKLDKKARKGLENFTDKLDKIKQFIDNIPSSIASKIFSVDYSDNLKLQMERIKESGDSQAPSSSSTGPSNTGNNSI